MQRAWKPVLISNSRADDGNGDVGNRFANAASLLKGAPADDDRRADVRFAIGAAIAVGLPALIGGGLYLAATVVLKLS